MMQKIRQTTLNGTIKTDILIVKPAPPNTGIVINNIPASVEYAIRHDFRVDLFKEHNYAFIVEHPLAALKMFGIDNAIIIGIREKWDFFRPEDRLAYCLNLTPSTVVGPADGTISGGVVEEIEKIGIKYLDVPRVETTVRRDIEFVDEDCGWIKIHPKNRGEGITIKFHLENAGSMEINIPPSGLSKKLRPKVANAVTPFLNGNKNSNDCLLHALGDLIGDIWGLCGLNNCSIEAELANNYHKLTIGALKNSRLIKRI
ncbi:MAG: hypothetical protein ACTSSJ_02475 [Candidatus Odinarchaeia archaeon]